MKMPPTTEFQKQFEAFAKFGDPRSDGKQISLTQSDKWMKQARLLGVSISTTDTAINFKKMKSNKLSLAEYLRFLEQLTSKKSGQLDEFKNKMTSCGTPSVLKMKRVFKN